jgi:hypothetical protein
MLMSKGFPPSWRGVLIAGPGNGEEKPPTVEEVTRLLFDVLHQRTGAMGTKIEDILFEQNEELLHRCVKVTRHLQ